MNTKVSTTDITTQNDLEIIVRKEKKVSLSAKISARPTKSLVKMKSVKPLNLGSLKKLRKWKKEEA